MNTTRLRTIRSVITSIEKQFGRGTIMQLGDQQAVPVAVIPTGSHALNEALGIGGYPRGRIVEIFGPESGGKTTLALHAVAEAQKAGGIAAFIDTEHALDIRYAKALGVDIEKLLVSQPDSGEQALEIVDLLTRSEVVDIVVVDSVAALTPRAEIEGDMGDVHMGLQARLMSQALRKLTAIAHRTETTILFTNQMRHKIGVIFGSPETTTGGNALRFYASVRIDVRRIGQVKSGDKPIGSRTRARVVKNKLAPPFREAEFDIRWGIGIDPWTDLLDYAMAKGVVDKSDAFFSIAGQVIGPGRERAREELATNPELADAIKQAAHPKPTGPALASVRAG
jgi:recombination protein RecA